MQIKQRKCVERADFKEQNNVYRKIAYVTGGASAR